MSSNEAFKNIGNAFEVVRKTYESVEKLLAELDRDSYEAGFEPFIPYFLRWKSDKSFEGWMITSFIKVYKKGGVSSTDSEDMANSLYIVEISFEEGPYITISKFRYNDLGDWDKLSVSDHRIFYDPIREDNGFISHDLDNEKWSAVPIDETVSEKYRGLQETISKDIELTDLTANNLKELIFDEMGNF